MEWIWILVPLSLVVAMAIGWVFGWAARRGQFEDLESHGLKMLDDDDSPTRAAEFHRDRQ
ncbi:MAG: cbb3-type cytochrome oxidase assembly protein CcoS [Betaproteobacteria bacterium]|nr:cbb3-type cytochrome oxidase assembly protein CcoS [Betaproteobacteria bacterium]